MAEEATTPGVETQVETAVSQDISPQSEPQTAAAPQAQAPETAAPAQVENPESPRLKERFDRVYQKGFEEGQRQVSQPPDWMRQIAQTPAPTDELDEATRIRQEFDSKLAANRLDQETKEARREVMRRFQDDAREVEVKYPKYRQGSAEFDQDALEDTWELYQPFAKALAQNPFADVPSFAQFVDSVERKASRERGKTQANQAATLAQQASESALTPNTHTKTDRPFEELSIKEMEKRLGFG